MSKIKIYFTLLLAIILAYFGSIKFGFSQDDWYFLHISTAKNFAEVLNFFNPWSQSGFAFYRPLGTQLYYYLAHTYFGLQSAPTFMHIFMILIQSLSAYNIYRLVKHLSKDLLLSFLIALIYATSSVHFLSFYYIAATQQLLAALFALLSINNYLEQKSFKSGLYFGLALLSKEVAIVAPIIMILADFRINHQDFKLSRRVYQIIPVGIVGLSYICLRIFGGLQVQSEYHLVLNSSVISTIRWYILFGYGAPEELVRYGLPKMMINYLAFIRDFGIIGFLTSIFPTIISLYMLVQLIIKLINKNINVIIYGFWWVLALLPVLLLQDHRYPHYVDLALIPMLLLILEDKSTKWRVTLSSLLIILSACTIYLSETVHWTTKRAKISESALSQLNQLKACEHNTWSYTGPNDDPKQLSYALSLSNGPSVICNQEIQVYYQGMTMGELPVNSYMIDTQGIEGI